MEFFYAIMRPLVRLSWRNPKWIIDALQVTTYDRNGRAENKEIGFRVKRWEDFFLTYENIATFETLEEAQDFIKNHKHFPIDMDGVN